MDKSSTPSLTIFFPCYNEAGAIADLVERGDLVARELTADYEIIVVDDGSRDGSQDLLKNLQSKFPRLRLIVHESNRGYGAALQSGFAGATKDWVFYTDGDGQYDVFDLRRLFPLLQDGISMVNGYKISRNDEIHRIIVGKIYLHLAKWLFNVHLRDINCDFRLIRRKVFETIRLRQTGGVIGLELVKKMERAGYRIMDCPVPHYRRLYGKSQFFKFRSLLKTGWDMLTLWWELKKG